MVMTPDSRNVHEDVTNLVQMAYAGVIEPGRDYRGLALHLENGRVLTDDFNPVDFFDAANREGIRRQLASSMRQREQRDR
jgi:hypothetical protein